MTTTEQALKASSGPVLPETLAARTGRSVQDTLVDLSMLTMAGKAEEIGGRWRWMPRGDATSAPSRAKARKGSKKPPVMVHARPQPEGVGRIKRQGKGWKARQGAGKGTAAPYPIQMCTTRYKDPETGKFTRTPAAARAGQTRKGKVSSGLVLIRSRTEGEVTGARVIHQDMRAAQRRGKVSKAQVREAERDLSSELLAASNPRLAAAVDSERMRAAHNSDKARRGALTRKTKADLKKHRSAAAIRTDHLKALNDLQEARRRLSVATTTQSREMQRKRIRTLNLKLGRLVKEGKAAGLIL